MNIKLASNEVIHFIGIGCIGMSGLALVMKNMGFKVQGSERITYKSEAVLEGLLINSVKVIEETSKYLFSLVFLAKNFSKSSNLIF